MKRRSVLCCLFPIQFLIINPRDFLVMTMIAMVNPLSHEFSLDPVAPLLQCLERRNPLAWIRNARNLPAHNVMRHRILRRPIKRLLGQVYTYDLFPIGGFQRKPEIRLCAAYGDRTFDIRISNSLCNNLSTVYLPVSENSSQTHY